jgi:hypothetical protein
MAGLGSQATPGKVQNILGFQHNGAPGFALASKQCDRFITGSIRAYNLPPNIRCAVSLTHLFIATKKIVYITRGYSVNWLLASSMARRQQYVSFRVLAVSVYRVVYK